MRKKLSYCETQWVVRMVVRDAGYERCWLLSDKTTNDNMTNDRLSNDRTSYNAMMDFSTSKPIF